MSITEDLTNTDSALVKDALMRRCDQCRAAPGELCTKRGGIHQDLLGRVVHLGRLEGK